MAGSGRQKKNYFKTQHQRELFLVLVCMQFFKLIILILNFLS